GGWEGGAKRAGGAGRLRHAVSAAAVDLFVPLSLDLCGRVFESGDRQPPVSLIRSVNRQIHRWCGSCCRDLGHGWLPSTGHPSYPGCVERVLTAGAEMPTASRSLATALP